MTENKSKFLEQKIVPYDPKKVKTFTEMLESLELCAFQGRNLGTALRVMNRMYNDQDCLRVMTISEPWYQRVWA